MEKIPCSRNWHFLIKLVSAWKIPASSSDEVVSVWQPFIDFTGTCSLLLLSLNLFLFFPSLCTLSFQATISQNKFYWKRIKEWETLKSQEAGNIFKFHSAHCTTSFYSRSCKLLSSSQLTSNAVCLKLELFLILCWTQERKRMETAFLFGIPKHHDGMGKTMR